MGTGSLVWLVTTGAYPAGGSLTIRLGGEVAKTRDVLARNWQRAGRCRWRQRS